MKDLHKRYYNRKQKKIEIKTKTKNKNKKKNHFKRRLDYKNTFRISLKYLKMYSIRVFFCFFFAKSCFDIYLYNHNNINMNYNMNDIQNSNNYSHIITLLTAAFWPFLL